MDEPFVGVDAATEDAILKLLRDMKNEGKTVVIVHHDLQTANEYFDWIVLLNTRLVAAGPKEEVFTKELLQEAYGGRLTVLSKLETSLGPQSSPFVNLNLKRIKPKNKPWTPSSSKLLLEQPCWLRPRRWLAPLVT